MGHAAMTNPDRVRLTLLETVQEIVPLSCRFNGEYHGPCPFCAEGTDRLIVWADQGRYWCRQCGQKGDAIQFLRDYYGLSYRQARRRLGLNMTPKPPAIRRKDQRWRDARHQVHTEFTEWRHFMLEVLTSVYRTRHHSIGAWEKFLVTVGATGEAHTLWQESLVRLYAKAQRVEPTLDLFTYNRYEPALLRLWDQWVNDSEDVQIHKLLAGQIIAEDMTNVAE